jgi:transposase
VRVVEERALLMESREFSTTTGELLLLRDWLSSFEVELVGMETTNVYWKPIYYQLVEHGLVRPNFVPPKEFWEL